MLDIPRRGATSEALAADRALAAALRAVLAVLLALEAASPVHAGGDAT